jgi:hypothetical protein
LLHSVAALARKRAGSEDPNRPLTCGGAKGIRTPDLLHAIQIFTVS